MFSNFWEQNALNEAEPKMAKRIYLFKSDISELSNNNNNKNKLSIRNPMKFSNKKHHQTKLPFHF